MENGTRWLEGSEPCAWQQKVAKRIPSPHGNWTPVAESVVNHFIALNIRQHYCTIFKVRIHILVRLSHLNSTKGGIAQKKTAKNKQFSSCKDKPG
jgi:hypothetical protein